MELVLVGDPVAHSRSPAIHRAALRAVRLQGDYRAVRVDEAGLARAVEGVRSGELAGANVTMPYKQRAARLCDLLAPEASRTGAVNTLVRRPGSVVEGHNTDLEGIRRAWRAAGLAEEGPVLVLGAGGAAAAALVVLEDRRPAVSARRPESARDLVERLGIEAEVLPWGTSLPGAVLVNATPLGMRDEPLPPGLGETASGLLDLAYGSRPTPAVTTARRRAIPVADGLEVLVGQAMASFRLWTGRDAPEAAMRAAVGI